MSNTVTIIDSDENSSQINQTSLISHAKYNELIQSVKAVNRLPKQLLEEAKNLASQRQFLSEIFLNEKGIKAQMVNHDTLDTQIKMLNQEIEDLSSKGFDVVDADGLINKLYGTIDEKRKMLALLIKAQVDLQKDMKYTPDKSSIQINNNLNIQDTKKADLFKIHRERQLAKNSTDVDVIEVIPRDG